MTKVNCYISHPEGGCEDVGEIVFPRHTLVSNKELKALKDRITELESVVAAAVDNAYTARQDMAGAKLIATKDVHYVATGIGSSSHEFIKDES